MSHPVRISNTLLLGDGIPKICIPVTGRTVEEISAQSCLAAECPPDLIEWRADHFREIYSLAARESALAALAEASGPVPLLFTFRSESEGGEAAISAEGYCRFCLWAADRPEIAAVDVEGLRPDCDTKALIRDIRLAGTIVIASRHFFSGTPSSSEMEAVLNDLAETGADIVKMAVMPACAEDVIRLMSATEKMHRLLPQPLITMAMGKEGAVSRVSGTLTGSALTFGTAGAASAPGQLPAAELRRILDLLQ